MADDYVKVDMPESEKRYYQPDEYYTFVVPSVASSTGFARVVTFDERKRTTRPSRTGLYVAEILLLYYCTKGSYPHPEQGYPGFWWFEYGIRDVGAALKSLERHGYIEFETPVEGLSHLRVPQLKEIAKAHGLQVSGKKSDIIARIKDNLSDEQIAQCSTELKYKLTPLGKDELKENQYVPYMHDYPYKTVEGDRFGPEVTVWAANRLLISDDKSNWRDVITAMVMGRQEYIADANRTSADEISKMSKVDPELAEHLKTQDEQIKAAQIAEAEWTVTHDTDALISFWEGVWKSGGLQFNGAHWVFRLTDLYEANGRYEDALKALAMIKNPVYKEQKKERIDKIAAKLRKTRKK